MGDGRAGWYWWTPGEAFPEYARFVTRTDEILEQFQTLNVGDRLSDGGPYVTEERGNWTVRAIEPNSNLVLFAARRVTGGTDFDADRDISQGFWFVSSWAFVLKPIGPEQTRLLVRVRAIGGPAWRGETPVGWGQVDDAESIRASQRALDLGVAFFVAAGTYGAGHRPWPPWWSASPSRMRSSP